jgi:hypothetical protein
MRAHHDHVAINVVRGLQNLGGSIPLCQAVFYQPLRILRPELLQAVSEELQIRFRWKHHYSLTGNRNERLGNVQDNEPGSVVSCQRARQPKSKIRKLREIGWVKDNLDGKHGDAP